MKLICGRQALTVLCCLALTALVACSSKPRGPIPVEDRVAGQSSPRQVKATSAQAHVGSGASNAGAVSTPINMGAALPGSENAGKPGYYSVRPGDTLTKIALDHGQAWRDIAKWNGLDNPNVIEVDQVLRVAPDAKVAAAPRPVAQQANAPAPAGQPAPTAQPAPPAQPATTSAEDAMALSLIHI
jgi:lipoprotein NlpD